MTSTASSVRGFRHQWSTTLDLPPSCVEFSLEDPSLMVVGTYNLDESDPEYRGDGSDPSGQDRSGSLNVFQQTDHSSTWNLLQTLRCPSAVLDLKFSPLNPSVLSVALSAGSIGFYILCTKPSPSDICPPLSLINVTQIFAADSLITSLAFDPTSSFLATTQSTGEVHLLRINQHAQDLGYVTLQSDIHSHKPLEAWCVAFGAAPQTTTFADDQACTIYSGGDDSALLATSYDRSSTHSASGHQGHTALKKLHGAGVVAILPLPVQDIVLTGSYDEHIRVINTASKTVLAEARLGGGVWRLKHFDIPEHRRPWTLKRRKRRKELKPDNDIRNADDEDAHSTEAYLKVLCSCMHAGSRVIEVVQSPEGGWRVEILAKFDFEGWEERRLNYGSDVQPRVAGVINGNGESETGRWCVSTSFYDKLVCLWRFEEGEESKEGGKEAGVQKGR